MYRLGLTLVILAAVLFVTIPCQGIEWSTVYSGAGWDEPHSIQPTADGGYIVVGETLSFRDGYRDFWILKLDFDGSVSWEKVFGGATAREEANAWSVQQTPDGGYIVAGRIFELGTENLDVLVTKLYPDGQPNPADRGAIEWQKRFGEDYLDLVRSVDQTSDGGYVVAGNLRTDRGRAYNDLWVVKLDSDGSISWQNTYGTSQPEQGYSVQQTADGGYIVAGFTEPDPFDFRNADAWVLKLYPDGQPGSADRGAIEWQRKYDNIDGDQIYSIVQTTDGGYIMTGITNSLYTNSPESDLWVVKLFSDGTIDWEKRYGGDGADVGWDVKETSDGGYVVAGATATRCFSVGCSDFWILKLNTDGTTAWEKTYGGSFCDYAYEIHETPDGGYIVTGDSASFGSPDNGHEVLVLKLDVNGEIPGCNAMGTSAAVVADTSTAVVTTTVTPVTTTAIAINTNLVSQATTAEQRDACFAPYIDEILPAFDTGRRFAGQAITLIGDNFGNTQGSSVVNINGRAFDVTSTKIKIWSDKLIRTRTPKYDCSKFNADGFRKRKLWVDVGGVSSNEVKLKLTKPKSCP
jgi:uncharacterized delta-60 repeat protein